MQYGQLTLPNTSQVFLLISNFTIGREEEARTLALEVIPVVSGDLLGELSDCVLHLACLSGPSQFPLPQAQ